MFLHPYFRGIMSLAPRALAVGCTFFFLAIAWFDFGQGLNIPALMWHDRPVIQVISGFSIAWLFAYVWLLTYINDARYHPEMLAHAQQRATFVGRVMGLCIPRSPVVEDQPDLNAAGDGLRWYLGVTFLPSAVLLLVSAGFGITGSAPFVHLKDPQLGENAPLYIASNWPFLVGVVVMLLSLRLFAVLSRNVRNRLLGAERGTQFAQKYWLHMIAGLLFVVLLAMYAIFALLSDRDYWQAPPITTVCLFFGMAATFNAVLWFYLRSFAILAFVALAVWVGICNQAPYRLHFPHLEPEYRAITNLEDFEEPAASLEDLVSLDNDPTVKKKEIQRVVHMVAAVGSQRVPERTVQEGIQELTSKGYADEENYSRLLRLYETALQRMDADERNALRTWKEQFGPPVPEGTRIPPPLVIVTATGGANRSGLWTAKVLHELHQRIPGFPKHLRIITGASGGMVGATYYVGSVQPDGSLQEGFQPTDISQDFLTPIINALVYREIPFSFLPTSHYTRDRGEMLDRAMEGEVPNIDPFIRKRLNNVFARTFADWAESERIGWRPSLIFSPMVVEDGRQLLISNRYVPYLTVNQGNFLLPNGPEFGSEDAPKEKLSSSERIQREIKRGRQTRRRQGKGSEDIYSRSAIEFFRVFPESRGRFHLSTAARMNATFPFLSPAVSLPTNGVRRVVDAGYLDNTGVKVATSWIYQYRDWLARNTSGVIVVQIRDFASHQENRNLSLPLTEGGAFLPGLTGPFSAVDHARSSSANYRNDAELQQLGEFFQSWFGQAAQAGKGELPTWTKDFFTTVVFERYSDVGMNWYLSQADKQLILDSWDKGENNFNPASLKKMLQWWQSRDNPPPEAKMP
ncbi:MAG: patatin-like phospholipase family protein [Zavarzinella sp.]